VFIFYMLAPFDPRQLISQSHSKASSKKRKRLDKYIVRAQYLPHKNAEYSFFFQEKKLKKEERVELFEKLA
jgi:hypothetical protein